MKFFVILIAFVAVNSLKASKFADRFETPTAGEDLKIRIIVWFRNETTLLLLWKPPVEVFTHYKLTIDPPDALDNVLLVAKDDEPELNQAAFRGLVPGRVYNISIQTVFEDEFSLETTVQYRTVPLRPLNLAFDMNSTTESSFKASWEPPTSFGEFNKYQVAITGRKSKQEVEKSDGSSVSLSFDEDLLPGKTYQVVVKTVSGKVTSWPIAADVTLRPLPVKNLICSADTKGFLAISWTPDNQSIQDEFRIRYVDVESSETFSAVTDKSGYTLEQFTSGRNYSITVCAVSKTIKPKETSIFVVSP